MNTPATFEFNTKAFLEAELITGIRVGNVVFPLAHGEVQRLTDALDAHYREYKVSNCFEYSNREELRAEIRAELINELGEKIRNKAQAIEQIVTLLKEKHLISYPIATAS